ncbi:MAG: hypothetical protein K0R67_2247 [Paenibacillus sp.]|jgi:hypothetical protein|nr:hypothetical protein [Paenibacillus sp.]
MISPGTILTEDLEFEKARNEGCIIEARQGNLRVYGPGKITAYGSHQVTVNGRPIMRSVNQFIVV